MKIKPLLLLGLMLCMTVNSQSTEKAESVLKSYLQKENSLAIKAEKKAKKNIENGIIMYFKNDDELLDVDKFFDLRNTMLIAVYESTISLRKTEDFDAIPYLEKRDVFNILNNYIDSENEGDLEFLKNLVSEKVSLKLILTDKWGKKMKYEEKYFSAIGKSEEPQWMSMGDLTKASYSLEEKNELVKKNILITGTEISEGDFVKANKELNNEDFNRYFNFLIQQKLLFNKSNSPDSQYVKVKFSFSPDSINPEIYIDEKFFGFYKDFPNGIKVPANSACLLEIKLNEKIVFTEHLNKKEKKELPIGVYSTSLLPESHAKNQKLIGEKPSAPCHSDTKKDIYINCTFQD